LIFVASNKVFTFVCGPDDFRVMRRASEHWSTLSEGIDDPYALEVVDGQAGNLTEAETSVARFISAVQTMPMFGDRKAVWFKNISFFGDARPGGTEGAKELITKVQAVLEEMNAGEVAVLLSASPFSRRSKKLVDWWKTHGNYEFLEDKNDGMASVAELSREAQALGVEFAPGVAEVLLAKINGNLRLALEEVRKLTAYLGKEGGQIKESHVTELVPNFGEGDFFETSEAFYSLDLEWTLRAIRQHFFAGHDGRPMITSLQNRNRLLIQIKALQDARAIGERISKPALEQAEARFGGGFAGSSTKSNFNVFSQNPWYLSRLAQPLQRLSLKRLMAFQEAFVEAFTGILERPNEQEAIMSDVAVRCLGQRG
jgi:DNA polymerase-3 subunit delta